MSNSRIKVYCTGEVENRNQASDTNQIAKGIETDEAKECIDSGKRYRKGPTVLP